MVPRALLVFKPLLQTLRQVPPWLLTACVLLSGLAITFVSWFYSLDSSREAARLRFESAVDQVAGSVQRRLQSHEQILRGGAALFNVGTHVSREQWRAYVSALKIDETYPGIIGVGYAQRVPAADKAAHIATLRAEGFPEYTIHPDEPQRQEYLSIVFLEPFWGRNLRAFGYDMSTDPVRREALERARDSGEPSMTAMVTLLQEGKQDIQPGYIQYLPVYRRDMPRSTAAERHRALQGFIYVPVRARDLIGNVLTSTPFDIAVELYDGSRSDPTHLLYASHKPGSINGALHTTRRIEVGGTTWTLLSSSLPAFDATFTRGQSVLALVLGLAITGALSFLVFNLTTTRNRAFQMAKTMTAQLRDSETRLLSVLSSAPDGILTVYGWGRVESANVAAEHIFGRVGEDILGQRLDELIDGHDPAQLDHIIATTGSAANGTARFEATARRAGGEPFPVAVSVGAGEIDGERRYTLLIRDITENKMAEAMLLLRERAIESSTNGIVITDMSLPDCPVIYVNKGFERITGYSFSDALGRNCRFLHGDEKDQPGIHELKEAIRESRPATVLLRNYRKDGGMFWNELSISPVFDDSGRCTHFVGVQNDITKRIRAEQDLQVRTERLDAIFALSPDGFVAFSADGRITDVNPAFLRMTGLDEFSLISMREEEFDTVMASLCEPGCAYVPISTMDSGEGTPPPEGEQRAAPRHTLTLGQPNKRILQRSVRMGADGTLEKVAYFRDITRETEVDRMKSEFLSTAAHELRTPMASIFGFSELLLKRNYPDEKRREMMATINRQASILINLINELLDLARIEARAGKDFKMIQQAPGPIIEDVISALLVNEASPRISVNLPDVLPELRIDSEKFGQCLTNVLSNACKYSPNGGDINVLALQRERNGQRWFGLQVQDHGLGMTPDQVARVFERFFRADPSGNIPGTGLGMSLVKEIMEIHGGAVEVDSESGVGTTVTLWLPIDSPARLAA